MCTDHIPKRVPLSWDRSPDLAGKLRRSWGREELVAGILVWTAVVCCKLSGDFFEPDAAWNRGSLFSLERRPRLMLRGRPLPPVVLLPAALTVRQGLSSHGVEEEGIHLGIFPQVIVAT
jgi:hypothetical protein